MGRISIKTFDENCSGEGIRPFGSTSATVVAQGRAFRPGHIPRGPAKAANVANHFHLPSYAPPVDDSTTKATPPSISTKIFATTNDVINQSDTSAFHVTTSSGAMTAKSQLKSTSSVIIRPQVADKVAVPKSTSFPSSTVSFQPISSGSGSAGMITVSSTSHVLSSGVIPSAKSQPPPPPPSSSLLIASSKVNS